jgi:8-oxo-dGTP pyrophosphatase MutT (NUDIX family)
MTSLHDDAVRLLDDERFVELLSRSPETVWRSFPGAHLTASTLVVDAAAEKVLLCLHGRFHQWVQLGGHCEPGDTSVAAAALREATEESGIAGLRLSPAPIHLDIHPVNCSGGSSLHYDVRFAAIAPPGVTEQVSHESEDLAWFSPDSLPSPLASGVAPLIEPALTWARLASQRVADRARPKVARSLRPRVTKSGAGDGWREQRSETRDGPSPPIK